MRVRELLTYFVMLSLTLVLIDSAHAQSTPGVGDLVINEIMYNPSTSEPSTEWFEIKNVSGSALDVGGCTITDGEDTHTIDTATTIPVDDYFVFGYASSISGVTVDYYYGRSGNGSGVELRNSSPGDEITIACGATTIDTVSYGISSPWPSNTNGKAISFGVPTGGGTNYATLNDNASNWKHSTSTCCSGSDFGTPGAVNDDILGATVVTLLSISARSGQVTAQLECPLVSLFRRPLALLGGAGMVAMGASLIALRRRRVV